MHGGSVYKDKVHEHPQYNTVQYKYMNITKHNRKNTENTWKHIHLLDRRVN
jgi:hypothetical protein